MPIIAASERSCHSETFVDDIQAKAPVMMTMETITMRFRVSSSSSRRANVNTAVMPSPPCP
jgi:hypothetical protein